MSPFTSYAFHHIFGVELSERDCEALFHLVDMDKDTNIGLPEFVCFVVAIKQIENKCRHEHGFCQGKKARDRFFVSQFVCLFRACSIFLGTRSWLFHLLGTNSD